MYQKVFKAGKYGDFEVTIAMLQEIASNYDTGYKKSPVNIDHWGSEAYGWIEGVQLVGDHLEADIAFTDEGKSLISTGKYKYPSVEFADYDGKPYLRAIALTNYNRVRSLPELRFNDVNVRSYSDTSCKLEIEDKKNSENKTNKGMRKSFEKLAKALSVEFTEDVKDEALIDKCIIAAGTVSDSLNQYNELGSLSELNTLINEAATFSDKRAADLVENAISSNKIEPSQKDKYLKLAKADYDSVSGIFSDMKTGNLFEPKKVKDEGIGNKNPGDDSSQKEINMATLTYEEVLSNPHKYIGDLSDEDIAGLKEKSKMFSDTGN